MGLKQCFNLRIFTLGVNNWNVIFRSRVIWFIAGLQIIWIKIDFPFTEGITYCLVLTWACWQCWCLNAILVCWKYRGTFWVPSLIYTQQTLYANRNSYYKNYDPVCQSFDMKKAVWILSILVHLLCNTCFDWLLRIANFTMKTMKWRRFNYDAIKCNQKANNNFYHIHV